jgi:general secretion pathway protein G
MRSVRGFTLIELLIVMAIIGMLAALVGPTIFNKFAGTQRDAALTQIRMLEQALDSHRLDTFKYPDSLEGLVKNTVNKPTWNGPYLKQPMIPKDPWGNDYQYKKPGRDGRDYDLFSFGADGQEGGEGENADIVSWEASAKSKS